MRWIHVPRLCLFNTYYLTLLFLTLHRLFAVACPFLYKYASTVRNAVIILVSFWILGITSTALFLLIDFKRMNLIFVYIFLVFDGLNIIMFIIAYTLILYKLIQSRNRWNPGGSDKQNQKKISIVFFLIVTSFTIFFAIPDIVYAIHAMKELPQRQTLEEVIRILWVINYCMDPLIYLYFQSDIRIMIKNILKRLFGHSTLSTTPFEVILCKIMELL